MLATDLFLLKESPETQRGLELIARRLLDELIRRCMYYEQRGPTLDDLDEFPAARLDAAFVNRRGMTKLPLPLRRFVKERATLRLGVAQQTDTVFGAYHSGGGVGQPEILLFFAPADFAAFRADVRARGLFAWTLDTLFSHRFTTLVHELRHAYDDWASQGRYKDSLRSRLARVAGRERGADAATQRRRYDAYLNDPIEISARYTQTVAQLGSAASGPWQVYLSAFRWQFPGWRLLPETDRRRLIVRLAAQWMAVRRPPERDLGGEVRALQDRLRARYGGLIYVNNHPDSRAISIDDFGTEDHAVMLAILRAVVRFADIRRRIVSTGELPFNAETKALGFVNQRGRHRNDALPWSTTIYRPARAAIPITAVAPPTRRAA